MKILHTADMHLDSAFSSENIIAADARRREQRDTFRRIMALAKAEACDLILIAGDMFDTSYVTPETEALVIRLFTEAECPIIISPGNHDPFTDGSFYKRGKLPENVYIFSSPELQKYEFDELDVSVYGYAFTSSSINESPLSQLTPDDADGKLRILCAHADLSSPFSKYAPITYGDLQKWSFDYVALGHIHNVSALNASLPENIRYCGFPEGRSFDELGHGGVIISELSDKGVSISSHRISNIHYEKTELDIGNISGNSELSALIRTTSQGYGHGTRLRIELIGNISPESLYGLSAIEKECAAYIDLIELVDNTSPFPDPKALENDPTLRGEFYRTLLPKLQSDDPVERKKALRALQIGLSALEDREISGGSVE